MPDEEGLPAVPPEVIEGPKPPRAIAFPPSSQIAEIIYSDSDMTLTVSFQRGGVYVYKQVPSDVADGFSQTTSAGRYLNAFVKDVYDYERIA